MSRRRTERWYTRRLMVLATRYGDMLDRKGYATLALRQRPQRRDPLDPSTFRNPEGWHPTRYRTMTMPVGALEFAGPLGRLP